MPRQAVVLGAGGGARAVGYGLIRAGFLRIVVFNRQLHRADYNTSLTVGMYIYKLICMYHFQIRI
jgi:shikimate 5-dehydrogenase